MDYELQNYILFDLKAGWFYVAYKISDLTFINYY